MFTQTCTSVLLEVGLNAKQFLIMFSVQSVKEALSMMVIHTLETGAVHR